MTDVAERAVPISEVFFSIEGEGPHTGRPTLFIRTFGCNFTCRGFSNRDLEPVEVDPNTTMAKVKTDRGCDSIYSWHPDYKKFSKDYSLSDLEGKVLDVLYEKIENAHEEHDLPWNNIIISITGGEPLLHQKQIAHWLVSDENEDGETLFEDFAPTILFETNGSVPIGSVLSDAIRSYPGEVVFSVSPKLSNSGEKWESAIRPKVLASMRRTSASIYLKFVSDGSDESLAEINRACVQYNLHLAHENLETLDHKDLWLMAEGATLEQQQETQRVVAEAALRNGMSFSPRAHVWIWGNTVGT